MSGCFAYFMQEPTARNNEVPRLLNRSEAKTEIRVSQRTLDAEVAAGNIGHVRIKGRVLFRPVDIENYITRCVRPARQQSRAI